MQELGDVWNDFTSHGLMDFYSLEPPVINHLGTMALENDFDRNYIRTLFDKFGIEPEGRPQILERWPWPLKIYTLGRFSIVCDGKAMNFTGKAQKKPLELLKAIIALGGRSVAQEHLAELLWPDSEGDAAMRSCSTTLYRLRKLLCDERIIIVSDNTITLNPRYCWIDTWAFDRMLSDPGSSVDDLNWALTLYKGHFMERDTNAFWMLRTRERLRTRYTAAVLQVARMLNDKERYEDACVVIEQGLAVDNLVEDFYQALMQCHNHLGRKSDALKTYHRCKQNLHELGTEPSARTRELHRQITSEPGSV
jgi:DNA-binding SARP family transcriptional activator